MMAAVDGAPPELASCGDDGLRVWTSSGKALTPTTPTSRDGATPISAPFSNVRWFPNGKLVAAAAHAGSVALYLHDTYSFLSELRSDTATPSPVTALDVSNGSRFVALGDGDGRLSIWDMKSRSVEFSVIEASATPVVSVSIQRTAESRYLACACGATVSLYSRASKRLVNRFSVESASFTALSFSPHRVNILVAADNSGCVTVWDITKLKPDASSATAAGVVARFPSSSMAPASDVCFSPSPSASFAFCIAGLDKSIRFFSLSSRREIASIPCPAPVTAVDVSPDSTFVAAGTATGDIITYQLRDIGNQLSHSLRTLIPSAHSPSQGIAASSAAVKSLHFRPGISRTASPPLRVRDVTSAPSPPVSSTGAVSAATASQPSAPPSRRDSDIFSPLAKSTRPRIEVPRQVTGESLRNGHNENPRPFLYAQTSRSSLGSSEQPPENMPSPPSATLPPSASSRVLQSPQSFGSSRRDTNFIPGRPIVGNNDMKENEDSLSASVADVVVTVSGEDPFADEPEESLPKDATLGMHRPRPGASGPRSLLNETFAAKEIAADLCASSPSAATRNTKGTPTSVSSASAQIGDSRRQSRSSSDVRQRLPPLPPRSLSDDAMTARMNMPSADSDSEKRSPTASCSGDPSDKGASSGVMPLFDAQSATVDAHDVRLGLHLISHHHKEVGNEAQFVTPPPTDHDLRKMVAEEVSVAVADLRSDVKNLHTELVVAFSRQEEMFQRLVQDKDTKLSDLESQVRRLRTENKQLRGNSRTQKAPVPSWM